MLKNSVSNLLGSTKRSISQKADWPFLFGQSVDTKAAQKVTPNTALTISALYQGVRLLSNSYALLPHSVYKKSGDGSQELKADHPVHKLLYRRPNILMYSFLYRSAMAKAVILRGNAFSLIVRDGLGVPQSLEFWHPDDVKVIKYKGELYYQNNELHPNQTYFAADVIHVRGWCEDGEMGRSFIHYAKNAIALAQSAQAFAVDSYDDKGLSSGVIESENSLEPNAKKIIQDGWKHAMSDTGRYKVRVIDEGMKYKPINLTPEQAQLIKTLGWTVEDIGRWLNIPSHKLRISGEGGYNSVLQMETDYLQTAVMPLAEPMRQENENKLFSKSETLEGYFIYQNYAKMLQVLPKDRTEYYKNMLFTGAITPNEIRVLEGLNPYDGGDQFMQLSTLLNEKQLKDKTNE